MKKKYYLGKCDYNGSGRKNCKAFLIWELRQIEKGLEFTMSGEIWNPRETDCYCAGQCCDEVTSYFPGNAKAKRMVEIWQRWHSNGLKAGSSAQEKWLLENPIAPDEYKYPKSHYEVASEKLWQAGLNPDPDGYVYGSAWKFEEIPADILAEIQSW